MFSIFYMVNYSFSLLNLCEVRNSSSSITPKRKKEANSSSLQNQQKKVVNIEHVLFQNTA